MDQLTLTLFEATALLNKRANELEDNLKLITDEVNTNSNKQLKDYDLIQKQLDAIYLSIDKLNSIEIKPEAVDYDAVNKFIIETVNAIELPKPKDGIDGKDGIGIQGERGEKGDKGEDGISPIIDYEAIKQFVNDLPKAKDGKNGRDGIDGKDAEQSISVKDIYESLGDFVFELTDGTIKRVKMPKITIRNKGNTIIGSSDGSDFIMTVNNTTELVNKSQTVLCDATSASFSITLPNPLLCMNSGRSYRINFTRKDITVNTVTILPFNGELILNEASQDLNAREVINLITDGINWYYGA